MTGDSEVWGYIGGLREDLARAEERIHDLELEVTTIFNRLEDLGRAEKRIQSHENAGP